MQITRVTSEALQATIRRLLPSQQGFGEDLQASNVITPIIDLTPTAEGSSIPENMQTALAFGSQTSYTVVNTTTTIANTAGFHRIDLSSHPKSTATINGSIILYISDGATSKKLYEGYIVVGSNNDTHETYARFDVFLRAGDSIQLTCGFNNFATATVRQIADVNGNLINPSGFTPQ